jgi:hypothetical protein
VFLQTIIEGEIAMLKEIVLFAVGAATGALVATYISEQHQSGTIEWRDDADDALDEDLAAECSSADSCAGDALETPA